MRSVDHAEGARPTVLIVDDSAESLLFLAEALERFGLTVLVAIDGLACLNVLRRVTPDLIVMDAMMPNLDGFETTRRIKADHALQHLPVIFMTGLTDTEHVVRGLGAGAVDFVSKPIIIDELVARIHVHLATARVAHGTQLALDTSGRPGLAIDGVGDVQWLTPAASAMVQRLFPDWSPPLGALPAPLLSALQRLQESSAMPGASVTLDSGESSLEVGFLRKTVTDQWFFRLTEAGERKQERLLATRHSLTAREAEVLLWISRGKQNREVSEILKISPRTVNKHLEQVFAKMGIENRASAAAIAVATLADA